jgi:hypothetical protein
MLFEIPYGIGIIGSIIVPGHWHDGDFIVPEAYHLTLVDAAA